MTKFAKLSAILIATTLLLAACSSKTTAAEGYGFASFYTMHDFAVKALGDAAKVKCMIPNGTEPHDWEPSSKDIVELQGAEFFVYSGAEFETWVPDVIGTINNPEMPVVASSDAIDKLDGDPHVWLSPRLAKAQYEAICDALAKSQPQNADAINSNKSHWTAEFDKLDAEFQSLKDMPNKKIIVAHAAFGYLCRDYGLEQTSITGKTPDEEPDPQTMANIIDYAKQNGITTIFYEEQENAKLADAIAKEIGGKTAKLSPLEGLTDDERASGDDYFSVMRKNLAALKEALG